MSDIAFSEHGVAPMVFDGSAPLVRQHSEAERVFGASFSGSTPIESLDVAMKLLRHLLTPDHDTDRNPLGECPECLKAICARPDPNAADSPRSHCASCDRRTAALLNRQRPPGNQR